MGRDTVRSLVWTGPAADAPAGTAPSTFELVERPLPDFGPGELLVRVRAAAVCGSDRHTVQGRRPAPCPSVLGHEGVGEITAIGAAPTAEGDPPMPGAVPSTVDGAPLRIGDRIVWSVISACRTCDRCCAGHTAKCRRLRKVGHERFAGTWPLSGSYASHVLLPAGHDVVRVPPAVADAPAAVAACAGATVMAALDSVPASRLEGARVLVSGVGMLGLLAIAAAAEAGAERIHAVDPSPARQDLARRAGASSVAASRDGTDGGIDLALELSGAPAGVRAAVTALDVGGTAVLAGSVFPGPGVEIDPEHLVRGRRTVTGVHNYEPEHLVGAVELLGSARGRTLPWSQILGAPIGLEEVPDALAAQPEHLRTVIVP
ncbi:alcohol dehydrogenase catalytic domain-containing protein [Brachybacterium sp. YJGR34]|uniref:alcohol dehydrogenase catalytic domain-containing protein n=1 Tax=Brachybacterium sp. YJGR34 TaxID=2059911 RepID=UPI000E0C54AE|nr:alcohol dehydrogenase catalytic domain-containing protein [Brachybacterium sp. YJGR34]